MTKERNYQVDILRAIGIILLILAHVNPPHFISEIRTFDVVLLAILSGISVSLVKVERYSFAGYVFKRVKRLVVPTYICLGFVFITTSVLCLIMHRTMLYDLKTILYSFVFASRGMGYVWIVKVYLIMAIFAIPLVKLNNKIDNDWIFFGIIILGCFFQHIIININPLSNLFILTDYLFYVIPYILLEAIGIRWQQGSQKYKVNLTILAAATFIFFTFFEGNFEPSASKYPPDYYYIIYGLLISCLLLLVIPNKRIQALEYISKNSFDIYLIHIVILLIYNFAIDLSHINFLELWWVKLLFVVVISIALTTPLNQIKKKLKSSCLK